jgi:hypothetical protein
MNVTLRPITSYDRLTIDEVTAEQDQVRRAHPPDYEWRLRYLYRLYDLRQAEDGEARFARQKQDALRAVGILRREKGL